MALIGYARVSTVEQTLALQLDALRAARCEQVFEDRASGTKADRPGLAEAITYVRRGVVGASYKRGLPWLERAG